MSEEIIKNDGSDSNEITLIITDETDKEYFIDVSKNATVEDVVKKIRGFNLRCFHSKDRKYFALLKGNKPITDSENIKKTIADLNIEGGDNIYVIARTEVTEKNKGEFLEIKKLETETESEQTSTVPNKNIGEITVYVKDLKNEKVELKLKSDAAFEDLLIALKKANRTSVMKSAKYFKLIFGGKNLSEELKSKNPKQVKINDLGIKNGYTLVFFVPMASDSKKDKFFWSDIKSVDEKNLIGRVNPKKTIIKTTEVNPSNTIKNEEQTSVNTNSDNLETKNSTSALDKVVNTEEMLKKENLILRIIRKVKSFFLWLYDALFGKCKPPVETINNNSQTLIENNIQQRIGSVTRISPHEIIKEEPININKNDRD